MRMSESRYLFHHVTIQLLEKDDGESIKQALRIEYVDIDHLHFDQ